MSKSPRLIFASGLLMLAILACNLPGSQSSSQPNLAATITAQAVLLQAPTSTSESQTQTPAAIGPQVSVSSTTNCRTGPGSSYDLVLTMNPGSTAQVVGKDTPDNYWIIDNPAGGTCWLWGQYATVNGDTSGLADYPPPAMSQSQTNMPKATKTPKPSSMPTSGTPSKIIIPIHATFIFALGPSAPTNFSGSKNTPCGSGFSGITPIWKETYKLSWKDNATNETGYRVYRNGSLVAGIGANSTSYTNTFQYNQGTGGPTYDTFAVEAYNSYGTSSRPTWDIYRCP